MKKRLLSALLAVCLLVSAFAMLSVGAHADTPTSGECGDDITWSFDPSTGKLTLTGTGKMDQFWDKTSPWYGLNEQIKSISVGEGITQIGAEAFSGSYAREVTLPGSIKAIWSYAFAHCPNLTHITIPDGVEEIRQYIFYDCTSLRTAVIPGTMTYCEYRVFEGCTSLQTVTFKQGVEFVPGVAFEDCINLKRVYLPKSLKEVRAGAFAETVNLSDVYYEGTEIEWNNNVKIVDEFGGNEYLYSATMHYNTAPIIDNSIDEFVIDLSTGECVVPFKDFIGYLMFTLMAAEEDGKMKIGVGVDSTTVIDVQNDGSYDINYVLETIGSESMIRISLLDGNSFGGKDYDYVMSAASEKWLLDQSNTNYTRKIRFRLDFVNPFKDVPDGKWYTNAVLWCYAKGYMTGTSATTFEPNSNFTRAMFVTVLAKIDGANTDSYTGTSFTDVPQGKWYSKPIQWAYRNEYASGLGGGRFGPNDPVTREQLAQFLYNYTQKKGWETAGSAVLDSYPDAGKISNYAKNAVAWAVGNGLISGVKAGDTVYLQPKGTATRAQVALIVKNYVDKFVK